MNICMPVGYIGFVKYYAQFFQVTDICRKVSARFYFAVGVINLIYCKCFHIIIIY
ncbi:hypothetical protein D3C71_2124260 [compost metagenome]